jgi:hypothetical protein
MEFPMGLMGYVEILFSTKVKYALAYLLHYQILANPKG